MSGLPLGAPFPRWALAVDSAVSSLSVLGGLAITIGYFFAPQKHHLRLKLILGLGVTDFVQALTTLAGTGLRIAGHPYQADSPSCLASSFVYQACVICNACWTLAITLVTYSTLLHPLSTMTSWLESQLAFPIIAILCVGVSIAPAIVMTTIYRMEDAAGVCWLPSASLAAKLELFIPRAFVLVLVILLYLRMFLYFRTRDMDVLDTTSSGQDSDARQSRSNRFSLARITSRRSKTRSNRFSQTSVAGWPPPSDTPGRRLSVIPASPALDGREEPSSPYPGDGPPPQQFRKDSAATVTFSDCENGLSGAAGHMDDALETAPTPVNDIQVTPSGMPSLAKHAPAGPQPSGKGNGPRNQPLSPRQLNKRLSLLMVCYPIAYSALVAVSLARLIQQLVTGNQAQPGLTYASRFLIFSQGAVDGVLYFVIQTAFRYWTRR
ncbi:hypothetical protein JCM8202_004359 [Rhodotorula sphaerocarpa]